MKRVVILRSVLVVATVVLLAGANRAARAADGIFRTEAWRGIYRRVKVKPAAGLQPEKILAAGSMSYVLPDLTTEGRFAVARYGSDGVPDPAYGGAGLFAPALGPGSDSCTNLVLKADGTAVVSGFTFSPADVPLTVARFTANGSLDGSFGGGGWTTFDLGVAGDHYWDQANAVGLQSTGKVVTAGRSWHPAANDVAFVARFTTGGMIDSGKGNFGQSFQGKVYGYTTDRFAPSNYFQDLAVQPDDKIVIVGHVITIQGLSWIIVARYTASGTLDKTFNGNGYFFFVPAGISETSASAVALQSDGKIVVAGTCLGPDGGWDMLVTRYLPNGSVDTGFGGGGGYVRLDVDGPGVSTANAFVGGLIIDPYGRIVVAGTADTVNSVSGDSVLVARFLGNGMPDVSFGGNGICFKTGPPSLNPGSLAFRGNDVALLSDGRIVVAGFDRQLADGTNTYQYPLLMWFDP